MVSEVLYRVVGTTPLSKQATRVTLVAPSGTYIAYQAGQYIKIVGAQLFPFSISCAPVDPRRIEFDMSHSASNQSALDILREVEEQGALLLRGPYGSCVAERFKQDMPIVFIAAGTGIAPVKALLEATVLKNEIHIYWVVATEEDLYLKSIAGFSYTPVVSRQRLLETILADHYNLSNTQVYVSGPENMTHSVMEGLESHGLKHENFYSDIFDYNPHG